MEVWCEVVCVVCATTTAGRWVHNGRIPLRKMRADAEAAGFMESQILDGEMLCRKCSEEKPVTADAATLRALIARRPAMTPEAQAEKDVREAMKTFRKELRMALRKMTRTQ